MKKTIEHILNTNPEEFPDDFATCKTVNLELKRGTEFLKSILLAIPDDILIIGKDKDIIWSNRENFKNKNLSNLEFLFYKMSFNMGCPIDYVFNNATTIQFETEVDNLHYLNIVSPCNYNGHVNTVLELRRNITEIKKIEEFKQLEKLIGEVVKSQENLSKTILLKKG